MANPNPTTTNLKPWKPGQSGNPKGRTKGSRNWSTMVQELLADESLANSLIARKPIWWAELPEQNLGHAIAATMAVKAFNGDVQAANWLRATGYDGKELPETERPMKPIYFIDLDPPELVNPPKPRQRSRNNPSDKTSKTGK